MIVDNAAPAAGASTVKSVKSRLMSSASYATLGFRALEPRTVFDAAGVATAVAIADQPVDAPAATVSEPESPADSAAADLAAAAASIPSAADSASGNSIVFIDAAVNDPAILMAAIGDVSEIIVLDRTRDGVAQIAAALAGRSGIDTIHILSHGESGRLMLGNTELTATSIAAEHADDLASIRAALSQDADILVYGCNVAAGDAGRMFVDALAAATGADIAASDDDTGHASRGGDWDLESRSGLIEAMGLTPSAYEALLAPLTLSTTAPPNLALIDIPVNSSVLWTNAGNIGGTPIDLRATVVSKDPSVSVTFNTYSDNPSVVLFTDTTGGGSALVRWEVFQAGTGQTVYAFGSPIITIQDIDGSGAPFTIETVVPSQDNLLSYTVANPSAINISTPDGQLIASGTDDDAITGTGSLRGTAAVRFGWSDVSSWEVTYRAERANDGRIYQHDGDGDFVFVNPLTVLLPKLDLDADNSSLASGADYQATFTENGSAVPIGDLDLAITNVSGNLASATVKLTNAQLGDRLTVGGSAWPTGTVSGLAYTISSSGSEITVTLTGPAPASAFEDALLQIAFENTIEDPSGIDRTINVSVSNGTLSGNLATATIHVLPVNDAPSGADNAITTSEDVAHAFTAAEFGFSDTDFDTFSALRITTLPSVGTLTLGGVPVTAGTSFPASSISSLVWTPPADANGAALASFTFEVIDNGGTANGGVDRDPTPNTITLNVTAVNDAPAGTLINRTGIDGDPVSIDVGAAFTDADGDDIDYTISGLPAGLSYDPETGVITGALTAGASIGGTAGVYTITVNASDGSATTVRTFTLAVANVPPTAGNDTNTANENTTQIGGNVLGNDDDGGADSDALSVTAALDSAGHPIALDTEVVLPSGAKLTLRSDGSYVYTPNGAFEQLDLDEFAIETFSYTIDDSQGGSASATVTITIHGRNDAPVAGVLPPRTAQDGEDVYIDLGALYSDVDDEPLQFTISGLPDGLSFDPGTGLISGTVSSRASLDGLFAAPGGGSVYIVQVAASDGDSEITRSFNFRVTNPAPVADNDADDTSENGPAIGGNILDNDYDGASDNDTLTVTSAEDSLGDAIVLGASVMLPSGALLTLTAAGAYTYDPNGSFEHLGDGDSATDTFSYTISDGQGGTATAMVSIAILGVNDAPVAANDDASIGEDDASVSGNLISGAGTDTDADGDTLTVVAADEAGNTITIGTPFTTSGGGALIIEANGSWSFAPGSAYNGLDAGETVIETFSYTIEDGNGGSATAELVISITGRNDGPVVVDPASPGTQENPVAASDPHAIIPRAPGADGTPLPAIEVGEYIVDPDGEALVFALDPSTPDWLAIDPATGALTGTPPSNASQLGNGSAPGEYLILVSATDPHGAITTTTVRLAIVNLAPIAEDDAGSIAEDTAEIGGDLLGNDSDAAPDADMLAVLEASQASNPIALGTPFVTAGGGTLIIETDGTWSFAPGTAYNGLAGGETALETIAYTVTDGSGGTATAVLAITITGANDGPVVVDPSAPGTPDNPTPAADPATIIPVTSGADGSPLPVIEVGDYIVDPDGEALTFALDPTAPTWLSINPATGAITGTPPPDASQLGNGSAPGVYEIAVTATDPHGAVASTIVRLAIVNEPPVANSDSLSASENGPAAAGDVLANDHDTAPDSDDLVVLSATHDGSSITLGAPFETSGGGLLTLYPDGTWTFEPGTAYNGLDAGESITEVIAYTISDGNGGTATATLEITIAGANDTPVVIDPANPGTPANPVPAGDPATIIPAVTLVDGAVLPAIEVGGYIVDPDGEPLAFALDPSAPSWLSIDPATGTITGTLPADASEHGTGPAPGEYVVLVTATDPDGETVTTAIRIVAVNLPPVAVDDLGDSAEDTVLVAGNLLDNDNDQAPDNDELTVTGASQLGNPFALGNPFITQGGGTVTIHADGTWSFAPGTAYNGLAEGEIATEVIEYTIADTSGADALASLVITIRGANDGPVVIDPTNPGTLDNPVAAGDPGTIVPLSSGSDGAPIPTIDVGNYVVDPDGDPLVFALDPSAPSWLHIDPATGIVTGTPPADASQHGTGVTPGTYVIPVHVTDPAGVTATVTIRFAIANLPPVAVDDTSAADEDTIQSGNVITHPVTQDSDTGPDTDPLHVVAVSGGTVGDPLDLGFGTLLIVADGTWTFTPSAAANALPEGAIETRTVTYIVSDGNGGTAEATLQIAVEGRNDAAAITGDDAATLNEDATSPDLTATGRLHAADPDAGESSMQPAVLSGTYGMLSIDAMGCWSYTASNGQTAVQALRDGEQLTESFVVHATDGTAHTIVITIVGQNDRPAGSNSSITTDEDRTATGSLPAAGDAEDDPLSYTLANEPAHGTVVIGPDRTFSYVPQSNFNGADQFTYTVSDGRGGTSTYTVDVTIAAVNDAPIVAGESAIVRDGRPIIIDVLANDYDIEGDALHVAAATADWGSVVITGDGRLMYTATPGVAGLATITYVVADGSGGRSIGSVAVDVQPFGISPLFDISPLDGAALNSSADGTAADSALADNVVLATVNALLGLSGSGRGQNANGFVASEVMRIDRIAALDRLVAENRLDWAIDVEGLTGFSLRLGDSGATGSTSGQLVIETLVRDRTLIMQVTSTYAMAGREVAEHRVMLSDGRPLPEWLNAAGNGLHIGRSPPDVETLRVRVETVFADGTREVRDVQINTRTGEITVVPSRRAELAPPLFSEQIRTQAMLTREEGRKLSLALAG